MRKILGIILLIVSINSMGQNPANYQYRVVFERSRGGMFDSAFHPPRYNGLPVGLRVGSSTHDGAFVMDTLNGRGYLRWNGSWVRMANFSELATGSRFGVEDAMAGQNRIFTGLNNTYYLALDSLNYFRVDRDGVTRMYMDNTSTLLASPDNSRTLQIFNASTRLTGLAVGPGEKQLRIVPGTGIITYADTSAASTDTNFGNTDITFTADRLHTLGNSVLHISGNNGTSFKLDPVNALGELNMGSTGFFADGINLTNTLKIAGTNYFTVDGVNSIHNVGRVTANIPYVLIDEPNDRITLNSAVVKMQEMSVPGTPATGYSYLYIKADGKLYSKDDAGVETDYSAGGGGGTVTSVSFTDDNFFDGTVATPTTTPAISIVTKNALFNPFDVVTNFGFSDQVLIRQSSFGSGSTIGTLSVTTIFDGWMFGQYMETGTTTTGSAYNYSYSSGSVGGIAISNSFRYNAGCVVRIPVLSDGTDDFNYMMGFADDAGNGVSAIVDGIYFEYNHALNSGNWTFTTESNGTKTQTDTGIPVVVNTDYKLNVSVYNGNAFGYIDNVLVATNTTNIPTGTARATGFANSLAKTAGTTNRKAYVEYLGWGKRPN